MKNYFLLVFIFLPITVFADVICNITYNTYTPVCGAEGELSADELLPGGTLQEGKSQPQKITYRTLLLDGDSTGAYNDLTLTESKIIGLGSTFTEAWNDAHDVCERAGCTVQSCDLATEENIGSNTRIEVATVGRDHGSVLGFKCFCSYGIGSKWKEGNNSCGGFVDTEKDLELKNSIGLTFLEKQADSPLRSVSKDKSLSFYLNQSQELCDEYLKNMENVPSNSVAFIHSCWFIWAR